MPQGLGMMSGVIDCVFGATEKKWWMLIIGLLGIAYMFTSAALLDVEDRKRR
jgi:uncharacterized membrane protein YdcZ (DUF606 family)